MLQKHRPGPLGKSCLTCKQRHKKCDQRQPICKRCEDGSFECLGYAHNGKTVARATEARSSRLPDTLHGGDSHSIPSAVGLNVQIPDGAFSLEERLETSFRPLIDGKNPVELHDDATPSPESTISSEFNCKTYNHLLLDNTFQPVSKTSQQYQVEDYLRLFATRSTRETPVGPTTMLRKIINLQTQVPSLSLDPLKTFLSCVWCADYLLEQSDKIMDRWYLKPLDYPKKRSHQNVVLRLRNSHYSRWITLVTMCVSETFHTGDMSQQVPNSSWIRCVENALGRELAHELSSRKMQERLTDWIHLSVVKAMVADSSKTYQLLRDNIPVFLQLLYSDPTLWPSNSDFTSIPLLSLLCSQAHEAAYFALIDCTYAMASGLPQQLEYDTTMYQRPKYSSVHQWAHSLPTEFLLILADINACRDQSPTARDWKDVENQLIVWQPHLGDYTFAESWMTVTWYAVQESLKLALLAYLYLVVCGASSNDERIQCCVKQIVQVAGTVKKHGSSKGRVVPFIQYLVVGICARSETHRRIVREKLSVPIEGRPWLIHTPDFIPVLDHLWHGAAADGHPVKWSDYMRSREAVLPIMV